MQKPFDAGTDTYFVVRDRKVSTPGVGGGSGLGLDGSSTRPAAGHLEAGRRWLDWTAELLAPSEKAETPPVFTQIWRTSTSAAASAEAMRVAASALLIGRSTPDSQAALAVLRAAHSAPPAGVPAEAIELALARVEQSLGNSAEVLRIGSALSAQDPSSRAFFELRSSALARLKRWDELRRAAEERLRLLPDERPALRALASADAEQQQWASSEKNLRRLIEVGRAETGDYNRLAWNALFQSASSEQSLEDARRSVELGKRRVYGALHTLACVQAELGKIVEARATLLEAIELNNGEPLAGDHYVLGRIAESLGMNDVALAEYRQAKTPGESFTFSTSALAERRQPRVGKIAVTGDQFLNRSFAEMSAPPTDVVGPDEAHLVVGRFAEADGGRVGAGVVVALPGEALAGAEAEQLAVREHRQRRLFHDGLSWKTAPTRRW